MEKKLPPTIDALDGNVYAYKSTPPSANGSEARLTTSKGKSTNDISNTSSEPEQAPITCSEMYTITLLLLINFVNFADRYTVPTMLEQIAHVFDIKNQMILGLLQTVFVITYMIFSPIFGYLGDRFNRRILMAIGLFVWGSVSLGSAFVDPKMENSFWLFLSLRAMIGIGEASYVTISPTIISDLFVGRRRTIILLIYQSLMLIGSGVGYMVASKVSKLAGSWHYAFMVWPPIVFLGMIGLIFMKEPERGKAEKATNLTSTSYWEDVKYLVKIKSYVFCTLGYTSLVFVIGAISFWAPTFAEYQLRIDNPDNDVSNVGFVFGVITILGGVAGSVLGTFCSKLIRKKKAIGDTADAIACAVGGLASGPLIFLTLAIARYSSLGMWMMIFASLTFLSVNLVLNQEITLYIMIPTRRATGSGLQILISHLLGDAISPYICGAFVEVFRNAAISDTYPPRQSNNYEDFVFRQQALFTTCCVCTLGAFFYLLCSLYVREDKDAAKSLAASLSRKSLPNLQSLKHAATEIEIVQMTSPPAYPGSAIDLNGNNYFASATTLSPPALSSGYSSSTNLGGPSPMPYPYQPDVGPNNGRIVPTNVGYSNDGCNESTAL